MRALGLVLIGVVLFVGWLAVRSESAEPAIIYVSDDVGDQSDVRLLRQQDDPFDVEAPGAAEGNRDLVEQVIDMCEGSCARERFVPLKESSGVINPNGVKFLSDYATFASFDVPSGWSGQAWDGFETVQFAGPTELPQVAEASFRFSRVG